MTPEAIYPLEQEQIVTPTKTVLIDRGEMKGLARNIAVPTSPARTPMSELQDNDVVLYTKMQERISEGIRYFDGYPYPGKIVSSELYDAEKDPLGNEYWYGIIYLRGNHYENEVGEQVPKERAWNGIEDETKGFVEVSTNIWEPGRVFARLIPYGKNDFYVESEHYQQIQQSGKKSKHLEHVEKVLLESQKFDEGTHSQYPMAAD